jgi:glycosyltransferase involved in cell wall biosynthesis
MARFAIDGRYIQDYFPGIGRYTYNLIAALTRIAVDDSLIVLHNPTLKNTRYDIAALARNTNVELRSTDVSTFSPREQFQLPISNIHLLHSPYLVKPYFLRIPSVVTIFDLIPIHYPSELPNTLSRLFYRSFVALAARTAMRVIVPSSATRADLVAALRVQPEKLAMIPLAADAQFKPQANPETARVREKYSLPERYVLCVGINKPHKNLGTLIMAWERAQGDVSLVIAGAWDARYETEQGRKGAGEIKFIRDVADDDLPALYTGAQVFVMPSFYEGFGLPLLEAMACGAPVLASNASSLPEVGGSAAIYFDPRDVDALAALITGVLDDRALQDELRAMALARAKEFSWERTARETLGVYHSAVKSQRPNTKSK